MVKNVRIVCIREVEQFVESTNQGHDTSSQQSHPTIEQSSQKGQDRPSAPKRVRGPTKKKEIWDLEDHQRILVTIDETGQPVGHEGSELTRFLGTLVRMPQHIGIQYLDWRKVPDNKKEDLWSLVKEKFSFEPCETKELKGWIMSDLSSKLKCWKYELKKKFDDQSLTLNEVVALLDDDRVDRDQFKQLATSWFTEEKQIEATKKKKNRLNSREPHVTGTKSFARLIHEEKKRNNGVRPSRGSVYRATRTRKDGSIVNSFAAEVVEKLKVVGESTDSTGETVDPLDWMNDDLSKVKGPESKGRVRCMGKVSTRKDKRLQDPQVPLLKAQVRNLHQGLMSFVAAVKLHIPNLDLSTVMSQMNMEVDNTYEVGDECSVDDNNLDKNARSTNSCHNNSKFSVHDKRPGKAANTLENAAGVSRRNSSTTYIRNVVKENVVKSY